jgi:hypothetical protein
LRHLLFVLPFLECRGQLFDSVAVLVLGAVLGTVARIDASYRPESKIGESPVKHQYAAGGVLHNLRRSAMLVQRSIIHESMEKRFGVHLIKQRVVLGIAVVKVCYRGVHLML